MKRFVYLGLAVFGVVLLWTGAWFFISSEIRRNVTALAEADGIAAPRLTCEGLAVTGFPFRFDLACDNAVLTQADLSATLSGLRASVLVYRPTHVLVSARPPLTLSDAFTGSQQRLDWQALEASIRLDGWRLARASLHADKPVLVDTVLGDRPVASADMVEAHLLDIAERHDPQQRLAALAAFAQADGVTVPGFAIDAGRTSLEAEMSGVPDDVRAYGAADALARWQAAGGKLQLVSFKGEAGEDFFETAGTIGLDSQARLEGQLTLASRGLIERMGDVFPPDWKPLIVGAQKPDGSYAQTLTIRAGTIFSGLIPIAALPPLL